MRFEDDDLARLAADPAFTSGWSAALIKAFRKRIQTICDAPDERTFRQMKSLHFEKLDS